MLLRRSPIGWLFAKEYRELRVSRAWWVLLFAIGPLTGISFIGSVRTYAEVSGLNGGSAGVGEALSPLIGVWAPTFSACELAAVFLLPFAAIGLFAGDRHSGALRLETQQSVSAFRRSLVKGMVLMAGWMVAMIPPLSAIALWKGYGGAVYPPEMLTLVLGHLLNAGLTIALAAAMASVTEHHATAAILTVGATVSTWLISFAGSVQGGWWERAAAYTPSAMVSAFQHGLLRFDIVLICLTLIASGMAFASIWIRVGISIRRRACESAGVAVIAGCIVMASAFITTSWDTSEAHGNSFPEPDETALARIREPLRIDVHLAPEDPRRIDLETRALSKLRRVLPSVQVHYASATSIGLFEQASAGYGEIWYQLGGRRTMSRATTAEGVLEAIYQVAGVSPPLESDDAAIRGHPLAATPKGAALLFYALWPGLSVCGAILSRRRI